MALRFETALKFSALLCALGMAQSASAQRFYFGHVGDNPYTSQVEQPGQEITGTLAIPSIGNTFKVQIWFEAGPYWSGRYNAFYPMVGFDKTWTHGKTAYAIDKKIQAATANPKDSISNLGWYSRYPGPGSAQLNFLGVNQYYTGGRNPTTGTNNPFGDTGTSMRPYGVYMSFMTAQWDGVNFLNWYGSLNPGERIRICDFTMVNNRLAVGDTYGDTIGDRETGLMLYKCASDSWNGTRLNTTSFARGTNLAAANGSRIALRAYSSAVPEPGSVLALMMGATWLIARRRNR